MEAASQESVKTSRLPLSRERVLRAAVELADDRGSEVLLRHRWVPKVLESRSEMPAVVLRYYDGLVGYMFEGGFSADLAHHAMHALGSRALGFTQELFEEDTDVPAETVSLMAQ